MANPEHLKILKQGVEVWNKWRYEYSRIIPDLSKANLSGVNLIGANLSEVDFRGAKLNGANLNGVNLSMAILYDADLRSSNLGEATMRGTSMVRADLTDANMNGADLRNIILWKKDDRPANFTRAKLRDIHLTDKTGGIETGGIGSFLDLASVEGLETVDFGDPNFLQRYLNEAFDYAHRHDLMVKIVVPEFVEEVLHRIKLLRELYVDKTEPPAPLVTTVHLITSELIKYLSKHPDALYKIRPRQFEELIAEILASYGWKVDLTQATKDGGYDIYAISPDNANVNTSWIIECKKYAPQHKVGVDITRALFGVKAMKNVGMAMLATTSYFTKGVHDYKASRYDLELKDYEAILEWINEYRPNPNGRLYLKDNKLIIPGQND